MVRSFSFLGVSVYYFVALYLFFVFLFYVFLSALNEAAPLLQRPDVYTVRLIVEKLKAEEAAKSKNKE